MKLKKYRTERFLGMALALVFCLAAVAALSGYFAEAAGTEPSDKAVADQGATVKAGPNTEPPAPSGMTAAQEAEFNKRVEESLGWIKSTLHQAETRTYQNKLMALELIHLVFWIVGLLVLIAVVIPLTLLYVSRRRSAAGGVMSDDMAATLVAVEERQAKLGNILKEIQGEIDYIHSMSVPDLKKLIEQAEKYIEQNEKDLGRASVPRKGAAKGVQASGNSVKPT